ASPLEVDVQGAGESQAARALQVTRARPGTPEEPLQVASPKTVKVPTPTQVEFNIAFETERSGERTRDL
ncbi:hypothetical protein scyTo_0024158, partial [Scyliorhinus torazame]|nr:hypothetical protein [Scyliorhinus torazame]